MSTEKRQLPVHSRIAALSRQFESAFEAHDARALVNAYFAADEDEPLASGPGRRPPAVGRAALIAMFEEQFSVIKSIRLEQLRLETSSHMAFELGLAHLSLAAGGSVVGRYTVLWKRRNGQWRAHVDFFAEDGWSA